MVKGVHARAAVGLHVERCTSHSANEQIQDCLAQVVLKLVEEQLKMIAKEVKYDLVGEPVHFFVRGQLLVAAHAQRCEHELRQLCENTVFVVLADGEVDVVAADHVQVQLAQLLNVPPLALVLVVSDLFGAEAVPEREELHDVLGRLFEHYESVDVPRVEADSILSVQDKLCEELKSDQDDFVIFMESVQRTLYNRREVLRV